MFLMPKMWMGIDEGGGGGDGDAAAQAAAAAKAKADQEAAGKGGSPDWKATVSPETQKIIELKGWKTPEDAIKGYSELERLVGQEKIPLPRKDKDGNYEKGELERFLGAVGMPKESTGYKLPENIKITEGAGLTVQQLDAFKPIAHKYGLLPSQFQGIMTEFTGMLNKGAEAKAVADTKAHEESVATLRQELGETYDAKVALANRVLKNFVPQDRADNIVKKYGNDPDIIKLLANVGENMSEEKLSGEGMGGTLLTPEQAEAEIKTIRSDPQHPYFQATHADHGYWIKRVEQLYKMAEKKAK